MTNITIVRPAGGHRRQAGHPSVRADHPHRRLTLAFGRITARLPALGDCHPSALRQQGGDEEFASTTCTRAAKVRSASATTCRNSGARTTAEPAPTGSGIPSHHLQGRREGVPGAQTSIRSMASGTVPRKHGATPGPAADQQDGMVPAPRPNSAATNDAATCSTAKAISTASRPHASTTEPTLIRRPDRSSSCSAITPATASAHVVQRASAS